MRLCRLYIQNFQQFRYFKLDFTHPETGEPLEKICFIGSNGIGKSTLLQLIESVLGIATKRDYSWLDSVWWAEFNDTKRSSFVLYLPTAVHTTLLGVQFKLSLSYRSLWYEQRSPAYHEQSRVPGLSRAKIQRVASSQYQSYFLRLREVIRKNLA